MANRQPVKALNKTAKTISIEAKAEQARKAASRKALAAQNAATYDGKDDAPAPLTPMAEAVASAKAATEQQIRQADRKIENLAGEVYALTVDTEALNPEFVGPAYPESLNAVANDGKYQGPMLALVAARKHYVKAGNGILCNGDQLATICGAHTREETVTALIIALKLPGNPYLNLNPGQQSMNLRNKARHALKNGLLTMAEVDAAFKA